MRNISIKGILIDTDKTFHLHMSLSIRSNGENVDIHLRNNFNSIETLVNMITISYLKKGTNLSLHENVKNSLFERLLLLLFLCWTKNPLVLTVHHPLQQIYKIQVHGHVTRRIMILHRNFINRSFVLLNKKWNSLQVFTLTSEEGGLVTIILSKSTWLPSVIMFVMFVGDDVLFYIFKN